MTHPLERSMFFFIFRVYVQLTFRTNRQRIDETHTQTNKQTNKRTDKLLRIDTTIETGRNLTQVVAQEVSHYSKDRNLHNSNYTSREKILQSFSIDITRERCATLVISLIWCDTKISPAITTAQLSGPHPKPGDDFPPFLCGAPQRGLACPTAERLAAQHRQKQFLTRIRDS